MRAHFLLLALVLLVVPACRAEETVKLEPLQIVSANGTRHSFRTEIADTVEKRTIGMMFRKKMDKDFAMLFVFDGDGEQEHSFWMKNTMIPLDIVFIGKDGTIRHIHPEAKPYDETGIPSEGLAFSVLEIKGGRAAKLGLKPGDVVHHAIFGNALAQ